MESCRSEDHVKKSLCLSKGELTQARGVRSMEILDIVPVKNFIFPVIHLQRGLVNYLKKKLLDFIESDAEKLSTGK